MKRFEIVRHVPGSSRFDSPYDTSPAQLGWISFAGWARRTSPFQSAKMFCHHLGRENGLQFADSSVPSQAFQLCWCAFSRQTGHFRPRIAQVGRTIPARHSGDEFLPSRERPDPIDIKLRIKLERAPSGMPVCFAFMIRYIIPAQGSVVLAGKTKPSVPGAGIGQHHAWESDLGIDSLNPDSDRRQRNPMQARSQQRFGCSTSIPGGTPRCRAGWCMAPKPVNQRPSSR